MFLRSTSPVSFHAEIKARPMRKVYRALKARDIKTTGKITAIFLPVTVTIQTRA